MAEQEANSFSSAQRANILLGYLGPMFQDLLNAIMGIMKDQFDDAILQERERCARVVQNFKASDPNGTLTWWGEGLAEMIRRGE